MPQLLARLAARVPLAIASNGRRGDIDAITAHFDLDRYLQPGYRIEGPISNKMELVAAYRDGYGDFLAQKRFFAPKTSPSSFALDWVEKREKGQLDPDLGQIPRILLIGDRFGDK